MTEQLYPSVECVACIESKEETGRLCDDCYDGPTPDEQARAIGYESYEQMRGEVKEFNNGKWEF